MTDRVYQVTLSCCELERKAYARTEVKVSHFLTLILDGSEGLASGSGQFIPGKELTSLINP